MRKNARYAILILLVTISTAGLQPVRAEDQGYSYGQRVGDKATNGLLNITTGWLEIPKSMININNDSNVVFGVTGGAIKGIVNMVGRMTTGAIDLVTAPLPTQPIASPRQVWDDFDAETRYGDAFRLQK